MLYRSVLTRRIGQCANAVSARTNTRERSSVEVLTPVVDGAQWSPRDVHEGNPRERISRESRDANDVM